MRYEYTILHIYIDIAYIIEDLPMKNTNMPLIYIPKYFLTYIIEDLPM